MKIYAMANLQGSISINGEKIPLTSKHEVSGITLYLTPRLNGMWLLRSNKPFTCPSQGITATDEIVMLRGYNYPLHFA
jgi:uncharacterized Zn-binding protein involved in type VI secretion